MNIGKRMILLFVMATLIFFGGTYQRTSAADIYMGTYSNGLDAWLVSEALKIESPRNFQVRIKAVNDGNFVSYIDYKFWGGLLPYRGGYFERFTASDGRRGEINAKGLDEWSPVEHNIFKYFNKKWRESIKRR